MKGAIVATLLAAVYQAAGHYTIPTLIANGTALAEWSVVRMTTNHWSNGPVTDVNDPQLRCYEIDTNVAGQTGVASIVAGSTVGFKAGTGQTFSHPGYFSAYMTPASPAANSNSAGTGSTWFKVWELSPTWTASGGYVFASQNTNQVTFTIPKSLKNGQYLLRIEHIALHSASSFGGAQFYISCAQVNVVGGGSSLPTTNLVSIPGVYTGREPGIMLNIYYDPAATGYKPPGPPVWRG